MAMKKGKELVYISSPYSHEDERVQQQRLEQVEVITANLITWFDRYMVPFSPIAYTSRIQEKIIVSKTVDWYGFDIELLKRFDIVLVSKMEGWEESYGVDLEIKEARKSRKEIVYVRPENIFPFFSRRYRGF